MNLETIKEKLRRSDGLSNTLGMNFISTPEPDMCVASMKVDERNRQPFGFLSGEHRSRWLRTWLAWGLWCCVQARYAWA